MAALIALKNAYRAVAREAAVPHGAVGKSHPCAREGHAVGTGLYFEGLELEPAGGLAHLVGRDGLEIERGDLLLLVRDLL